MRVLWDSSATFRDTWTSLGFSQIQFQRKLRIFPQVFETLAISICRVVFFFCAKPSSIECKILFNVRYSEIEMWIANFFTISFFGILYVFSVSFGVEIFSISWEDCSTFRTVKILCDLEDSFKLFKMEGRIRHFQSWKKQTTIFFKFSIKYQVASLFLWDSRGILLGFFWDLVWFIDFGAK